MRLGLALASLALWSGASVFAASKATTIREKFVKLAKAGNGVVTLDDALYEDMMALDRDWSVVLHFTALGEQFACKPCHEFDPAFKTVARSWQRTSKEHRDHHFFATLDFAKGPSTFRTLGIQAAPVITYFPALKGEYSAAVPTSAQWQYDFGEHGFGPEALARALSKSTTVPVPYSPPPNYGLIFTAFSLVLGTAILAKFFWPVFQFFFLSRWTWAILAVASSLVFTSGYMFTRIRSAPFAAQTRDGVQWIVGGFSNQLGAEVWVVSTLYGALALSQIALIVLVPRTLNKQQQRAAIYIWTGVTVLLYSILLSLFKVKNPSYPFKLLF